MLAPSFRVGVDAGLQWRYAPPVIVPLHVHDLVYLLQELPLEGLQVLREKHARLEATIRDQLGFFGGDVAGEAFPRGETQMLMHAM